MSNDIEPADHEVAAGKAWPRRLNKLLIGIGVLAFGLIIADRLSNMFEAEGLPADVDVQQLTDTTDATPAQTTESTALEPGSGELSATSDAATVAPLDMVRVFGSPLVFVSASDPVYVITENNVRIDVGGQLREDFTLAGVTTDRVILEKAGDLMSIALPDPDEP